MKKFSITMYFVALMRMTGGCCDNNEAPDSHDCAELSGCTTVGDDMCCNYYSESCSCSYVMCGNAYDCGFEVVSWDCR